jgi:hydroxypyruvate isomerase
VEFWFHDSTFDGQTCASTQPKEAETLKQVCVNNGVKINNMVVNAPDGSQGGSLTNPDDLALYLDRVWEVIDFAQRCDCHKAITCTGNIVPSLSTLEMRNSIVDALTKAADIAAKSDFTLLLEPLNTFVDHQGYFLDSSQAAADIVREIGSPNLKLLFDIYHMQIMEGNIISNIRSASDVIGHFHSAGVPGRNELFGTELNYPGILEAISAQGYGGSFGLEYSPRISNHSTSLIQTKSYLGL